MRILSGKIMVLVAATMIVSFVTRVFAQTPEPTGEIISVNGTNLHLYCIGDGSPTILLESGIGGFTLNWTQVQPILAKTNRVCSYDRRGYGWSDPIETSFSLEHALADLNSLIEVADLESPYLLVSHSFGAIIARAFQAQAPERVVGMIMLDPVHPQLPQAIPAYPPALDQQLRQLDVLVELLGNTSGSEMNESGFLSVFTPDDASEIYLELAFRPTFINAAIYEAKWLVSDMPDTALPASLDNLPLVVVAHGIPERFTFLGAPVGFEAAINAEEQWQALLADLTALSQRGKLVIATESMHSIQFDEPDLVVQLVREMLDEIAGEPGL